MDAQRRLEFVYLFERVGEPLYFSPRGRDRNVIRYEIPESAITCAEVRDAAVSTRSAFSSIPGARQVQVQNRTMPDLTSVGGLCPRSALYSYFNPNHRQATNMLRKMFLDQRTTTDLLSMAAVCRDSPMVNCKLWINAYASAMLSHPQTRNLAIIPAIWEVMPDSFFPAFTMREAFRQASLPERDRAMIDDPITGRSSTNIENRLAYFREDIGINAHHWHWHLVYRLDDPPQQGRRKGEMFYYMHHQMIARYDCERLGLNMHRVRPMTIDDNPVLKEGYFGKLTDTNSARNWGTRQANTRLVDLNRRGDSNLPSEYRSANMAEIRKLRDRVMMAIDTGMVTQQNGQKTPLNIDILGDIVEASTLTPNPQYYGAHGLHNLGHVLIAYSHDPDYGHFEHAGPMSDTTTAMRDPIFYRWHKYIDIIFDAYKQTLQPYQDVGGEFPLAWQNIQVTNVSVQTTNFGSQNNILSTYFMKSHADLSRGLDFLRIAENNLGGIWVEFEHLNHDPFNYNITVRNSGSNQVQATVRIYMAPRLDENGERFQMDQQRKLFIELDKFVAQLRPGENQITRKSTDSSVTIPWEQTFRDLERENETPSAERSVCGCGWPQHMLLPRGNPTGQVYDLVVFLTNAQEDAVQGATPPPPTGNGNNCREALSFCGRLGQPYPDRKPMGYPWDRNPFTIQNPNGGTQRPVDNLDQYVSRIPNMRAIQIRIVHNETRKETRKDGAPEGRRRVMGNPRENPTMNSCGRQGGTTTRPTNMVTTTQPLRRPGGGSSASSSSSSPPPRRQQNQSPPPRRQGGATSPISSASTPRQTWSRPSTATTATGWGTNNTWYRPRERSRSQSPQSPQGWTTLSRPGSPNNWGWGG